MNLKAKKLTLASLLLCAFVSTSQAETINKGYSYDELMSNNITKSQKSNADSISDLRKEALKDVALGLGTTSGMSFQFNKYAETIQYKSAELDKIYNFEAIRLTNGVLPPVLTQGFSAYHQENDDVVRISDKTFKIEAPAKFVSVYPTWRDYLQLNYEMPPLPEKAFLPKTKAEKEFWDEQIKIGWELGVKQATEVFEASYARLDRDYQGMLTYKILLKQGLITPTVVASSNLGVTGGGNEMSINDQIYRITDHAQLDSNTKNWKSQYPTTYQDKSGRKY